MALSPQHNSAFWPRIRASAKGPNSQPHLLWRLAKSEGLAPPPQLPGTGNDDGTGWAGLTPIWAYPNATSAVLTTAVHPKGSVKKADVLSGSVPSLTFHRPRTWSIMSTFISRGWSLDPKLPLHQCQTSVFKATISRNHHMPLCMLESNCITGLVSLYLRLRMAVAIP